ncbi:hypothetical protein Lalb_Chr03g0029591 [Lupinus albus]|uniref:Uncharacterized protein n=1 Tax=Lupinus albus TaxID=3870 RepID=A0A6A4QRD2_LUPAL|nr:hypothetical protein Lalb_Chr03g0029591 [Lupinus albus]
MSLSFSSFYFLASVPYPPKSRSSPSHSRYLTKKNSVCVLREPTRDVAFSRSPRFPATAPRFVLQFFDRGIWESEENGRIERVLCGGTEGGSSRKSY